MNLLENLEIKQLFKLLRENQIEARLVGGCVRDALLGIKTADIDVAINVPPEQAQHTLKKAGIKVIPTGIDHGTITAVVNNLPFQITSLRQDVQTFGRHAKVIYGTDWLEDAKRRDFTMNAMYLDEKGSLYDPFNGRHDLEKGIIWFIGDPSERIKEDYLRILRYYRFLAYYGKNVPGTIKELSELKEGLLTLSKERIQHEFLKLLDAKNPRISLNMMEKDGIFSTLFNSDFFLQPLYTLIELELTLKVKPNALRRLYILFDDNDSIYKNSFRLSRHQLLYLRHINESLNLNDRRAIFYYFGRDLFLSWILLIQAKKELSFQDKVQNCQQEIDWLSTQKNHYFPITGQDLLTAGCSEGAEIGILLKACEKWWIEQDFKPEKNECLKYCLDKLI